MAEPLTPEQRLRRAVFTLSDHYWDDSDQALRMTSAINEISAVADSLDAARAAAPPLERFRPRKDGCTCGPLVSDHAPGCPVVTFSAPTGPPHGGTADSPVSAPVGAPSVATPRAALHREDGQPDENERCAATYWNGKRTVTCGELRVNRVHHGEGGAGHEFALHREDGA